MALLPQLHYLTKGLPDPEASDLWREVVSPLFEPRPSGTRVPLGSATGVIVRDIIVARVVFNAQDFVRDADKVRETPGHILFQLYKSGGFSGVITGQQTTIWPGQVAIIDLSQQLATRASPSDTIALIVPKRLFEGMPLEPLRPRLDTDRNRLLAAHIVSLRERSAQLSDSEASGTVSDTVGVIADLLAPSRAAPPVTQDDRDRNLDRDLLALAEQVVRDNLSSPELAPDWLAAQLKVSRATLYRLFAAGGGIMRSVQERRLLAARAALCDPLESRRLSRVAADLGFGSAAHFSRSFRARFGITASDFRAEQLGLAAAAQFSSPEIVRDWWSRVAASPP